MYYHIEKSFSGFMAEYASHFIEILDGISNDEIPINKEFISKIYNKTPKNHVELSIEFFRKDDFFSFDLGTILQHGKILSDFIGNCNNTILFRNFVTDKGREVCYLNKNIPEALLDKIKHRHSVASEILKTLKPHRSFASRLRNAHQLSSCAFGYEAECVIKSDISAFFRSVKFENVIRESSKAFMITHSERFFATSLSNEEDVDKLHLMHNFFLSCLFHNGVVPTGASYANSLADLHLFSTLLCHFRAPRNSDNMVYFYVDDIFIFSKKDGKTFFKNFEKALNAGGLYLNYKKTRYFYTDKGTFSGLGVTFKSGVGSISVSSKTRKEILDLVRERKEFNDKELGLINYGLTAGNLVKMNLDILLHTFFNDKSKAWDLMLKGEHPVLNFKEESRELISSKFPTYKDFCVHCKSNNGEYIMELSDYEVDVNEEVKLFFDVFVSDSTIPSEKISSPIAIYFKPNLNKYCAVQWVASRNNVRHRDSNPLRTITLPIDSFVYDALELKEPNE